MTPDREWVRVQLESSCSSASPNWNVVEACRWTNGVAQSLGSLPGAAKEGSARSCNRNGSIVIGDASSTAGRRAFIWDAQHGMRELAGVLATDYGLSLTGWTLTHGMAMTPDGAVIVGIGTNPSGNTEGWIARLGCGTAVSYCTAHAIGDRCRATPRDAVHSRTITDKANSADRSSSP